MIWIPTLRQTVRVVIRPRTAGMARVVQPDKIITHFAEMMKVYRSPLTFVFTSAASSLLVPRLRANILIIWH